MKTKMLRGWRWMFAIGSTVAFLGCVNETKGTGTQSSASVSNVVTSPAKNSTEAPPARAVIAPANLSPGIAEIVQLAQSGVGEEVLTAYVEKSGRTFNPSVDEIVYLKDLGLSESVLASLVRKGNLTSNSAVVAAAPSNPETQTPAPTLTAPATPSYSVAAEATYTEAATVNPPQEVNINYFESTLSPYGNWVEVADYGRCWQPTVVVVNRNWRPYSDRGHWVYTSNGWYWQSDYSWGWAPFHYGRWHNDYHVGWVWIPGSTWGPAWVSWRYTDDYCGWAPLPPSAYYVSGVGFSFHNSSVGISFDFGLRDDCYTFIPTRRFCDPAPYRYYAPRSQSTTIYQNSVVINNYIRGNNNTIINEGVGRDRISTATRTPIRTVALRDLPTTTTPVGRAERIERDGSLAVFRPGTAISSRTSLARPSSREATGANLGAPATLRASEPTLSRSSASRSLTRTETATPTVTTPTRTPTASLAPTSTERTTFPRTWSQTTRPSTEQSSTPPASAESNPVRSSTPAQDPGSSHLRQLNVQNSTRAQEQRREVRTGNFEENNRTVAPRNLPSTVTPSPFQRESHISAPARTQPGISPEPRSQPTWRETQREQSINQNFGGALQRPSRSISPAPEQSAPAQRQQPSYSPPQMNRGLERPERSTQERREPAPVVAPRTAPTPHAEAQPAPRERAERGLSRSSRDRN